jgi:hypothetical protein
MSFTVASADTFLPISSLLFLIQWVESLLYSSLSPCPSRSETEHYSDAKSQADASGEAIVSLIADNQDNNIRLYTDVLADSQ